MAFGPIMRFTVGEFHIELAPLTREVMSEYINGSDGGRLQEYSVHQYLGMSFAPTLEGELKWYDKLCEQTDVLVWGIWVVEKESRTLIGSTSLTGIDKEGHTRLIRQATSGSLIFRKEYWGKGIASAAHKARTWYAFQYLGLHRIKSAVIQANKGSRKALERSGYTYVYTERNEQYADGGFLHLDCFELLNPLDLFWKQWWNADRPTKTAREARVRVRATLAWAKENVELA